MKKKIQKPFNAEAAKNGAVVETKGGRPVRIVCYDRKDDYPIIALVDYGTVEDYNAYSIKGEYIHGRHNTEDLVIVEEIEEAKFNVGDWVFKNTHGERPWLIIKKTPNCYVLEDSYGAIAARPFSTVDDYFRLWTLDDARPGDVLVCKNNDRPFIFKGCIDKAHPGYPTAYCGIHCSGEFTSNAGQTWWADSSVRPATYKERQQFFNRLEEEGYKWDSDSLILSKIQKRWRDNEKADVNGYYIDGDSSILAYSGHNGSRNHNVFVAVKQAKSALAMSRISQIMTNDERFGGVVTDNEWGSTIPYFVIAKVRNMLVITVGHRYEYLGFHTIEQANLFLKENEDLVKDYYMMD